MKHVNVLARIIVLIGLFNYGIAMNFGMHQFWACKCPPGFYAQGTNVVYASSELCKDKNESFIVGPTDFTGDITTTTEDINNVLTVLEACSKCAHGCATCKGPEVDECLECVSGYFAHPTQTDATVLKNNKTKRFSETRLRKRALTSQKIYVEDELLVMDGGVRHTRDEIEVKPNGIYLQNAQHLNEDIMFNDFKNYDDEESSGEVDEDRDALEIYISEQPVDSQVPDKDPKATSTLEVLSVNLENKNNNITEDQEPEVPIVGEIDSSQPKGDIDHKDTVMKLITENNPNLTHPIPLIEPKPSAESLNSQNPDQVAPEEGTNDTIPEDPIEDLRSENSTTKQTNLEDIFNNVAKDDEPADEPDGSVDINNGSSDAPASTSIENIEENSEISENVISTNTNDPLQNLNKVNQQAEVSVIDETSGNALIRTASYSCLVNCPEGHYNTSNRLCLICHAECEGCFNEGPTNCIKCRNYKKGSTCVTSCTSNETSTEKYNSNCELQSEDETIPAGYYAIPPLVILFVCACLGISYCRKKRKMKNSLPGRPEGMHKTDLHSSESSFTRMHLDQKKCFYKGSKPPSHIALTEFKTSSETLKRKGNPYVCAERPLLPKYAHQTATHSPAWSACKDMSEPEDDFDPLYETPDNTMDSEVLKRYHYRRRSSPSHVHFALTTSKVKDISNSLEDCLDTDSLRLDDHREYDDVDDLSTENCENQFGEVEGEHLEAPYYQAPPLPVRNSPSVQDIINDDHIYVNIDENV